MDQFSFKKVVDTYKQCFRCHRVLPGEQFSKNRSRKDGLCIWCKDCMQKYVKKYRQDNREKIKEKQKEKSEYKKAYMKKYRQKHVAQEKIQKRKYYLDNIIQRIEYHKKYNQKNIEHIRAQGKRYRQRNRARHLAATIKRKAAKLQRTPKWLTKEQLQQIIDFYINCPEGMTVDHIYPLQGRYVSGLHHPDNLQYLTPKENCVKFNKRPEIDDLWIKDR